MPSHLDTILIPAQKKKKEEEEEEGTSGHAFPKGPSARRSKSGGVASDEAASAFTDNLHCSRGRVDTFSLRVVLLSVYDEMLRGVSEETPCPLFLLDL